MSKSNDGNNGNKGKGIEEHNVEVVGSPMVYRGTERELGLELENLNPRDVVKRIEQWNETIDAVTSYAISKTSPKDWCALGTKGSTTPWLTGPGAERMARRCGLRIEYCDPPYAIETGKDDDGDFVKYTCRLRVSLGRWASIVAEGHCTSRDSFFSRGGRLSASRIDKGNLQQSAYTNALVNGVSRILGVRRMSWGEIEKLTDGKVREANAGSVAEFKRGGGGGASKGSSRETTTKEQRTAIWRAWCDARGIELERAPDEVKRDAAEKFYLWVIDTFGGDESKRDRGTWTESDVKTMRARLNRETEHGADDAPDAPDDDKSSSKGDESSNGNE